MPIVIDKIDVGPMCHPSHELCTDTIVLRGSHPLGQM